MTKLPVVEYKLLTHLYQQNRPFTIQELAEALGVDQSQVAGASLKFTQEGWAKIEEQEITLLKLKDIGVELADKGFPEREAIKAISTAGGTLRIQELSSILSPEEAREATRWLLRKGLCCKPEKDLLEITEEGRDFINTPGEDEKLVNLLKEHGTLEADRVRRKGIDLDRALELLKGRGAVKAGVKTLRRLMLLDKGKALVEEGIQPQDEVTQLTHELLVSGRWREVSFKRYDVKLPSAPVFPGKTHPLQKIIDETRRVFLEMGFTEISSPYVESCFWDFDALFQPQDHPAREMQDTFYTLLPKSAALPSPEVVQRVKRTHENGGDTGSLGWGYDWDEGKARSVVLRTHTTATTVRYLAQNPDPPSKVFTVGRVFRKEKITFKHLPEFHQVDGIIIDEGATFASLLGTLKEFYRKMGFQEVKFRPAFFPYTEPSVEVFVRFEAKGKWIELGGAGIFRPEVTLPFGCGVPVLAWGLGLERLAMTRYGIDDIRMLYWADIDWLREVPLCR